MTRGLGYVISTAGDVCCYNQVGLLLISGNRRGTVEC